MNNKDFNKVLFIGWIIMVFLCSLITDIKMHKQIKALKEQISGRECSCEYQQKQPEQPRNLHLALQ